MKCKYFELGDFEDHHREYWLHFHYKADDSPISGLQEDNYAVNTFQDSFYASDINPNGDKITFNRTLSSL